MDEATQKLVRERANYLCEYCRVPEKYFIQRFQIEHIVARSHRGQGEPENLALACRRCNVHKGPNLSGMDPLTNELTRLFNPRNDEWTDHFEVGENGEIRGRTDIGRTTAYVLDMNAERRVELRRAIAAIMAD
jgi:HNH endonuclease